MGARGPLPTPTAILKLHGSTVPARRAKNGPELSLPLGVPDPPDWLPEEARAEWQRVAVSLAEAGALSLADRAVLAAYCEAWAEFALARQALDERGPIGEQNAGKFYPDPYLLSIRDKACERLVRLAGHFGLSPATRARVRVGHVEEQQSTVKARKRG